MKHSKNRNKEINKYKKKEVTWKTENTAGHQELEHMNISTDVGLFFHFAYVHRSFIISVIKAIHKGEVLRKWHVNKILCQDNQVIMSKFLPCSPFEDQMFSYARMGTDVLCLDYRMYRQSYLNEIIDVRGHYMGRLYSPL